MHSIANLWSKVSAVAILSWIVSACTILPPSPLKLETRAQPPAPTGVLEEVTEQLAIEHGVEHSSLLAIESNRDALQWRLMLTDSVPEGAGILGRRASAAPLRMRMAEAHFIQDRPAADDRHAPRLYDMLA